jgi:hypothetical protein
MEGSGRGLILSIITAFACRLKENHENTVRVAYLLAAI